ncbi:hypothetical protein ZWY2020_056795 [Hordeum vulgare]|nr:hypothetical protein ZWY2020_056795 [Hordeum vulgare]
MRQRARGAPAAGPGAAAGKGGRVPAPDGPPRAPPPAAAAEDNPGSTPARAVEGRGGATGGGIGGPRRGTRPDLGATSRRQTFFPGRRRAGRAASRKRPSCGGARDTGNSTGPSPSACEPAKPSSSASESSAQSAQRLAG